ncbi:mechanosensitive ion channel family protein [Psychromonas sp. Urea-02u-13]|uniref:mechanosensitive ion channel family protein n=1 Tax=Psychromonas sp. Urea-02u-13 TaxID=2058326 RepID=UPI000C32C851|nr:mechanosensitive ion channel family protein [Psychromonas sp. Urea-02u-13]PKG38285.1 transporter small conductance mechanosensitive ion channel family protein [Psychromonas sp. Urea-02u-13]
MHTKWFKRCLLLISLSTLMAPFSMSFATTEEQTGTALEAQTNQAEQLLQRYQRQQAHIDNINNHKDDLSTLEQEALNYRLFSRYLNAFETLNTLSKYLIEEQKSGHKNPTVMAEIEKIIHGNTDNLKKANSKIHKKFNADYAEQEKYSTEGLHLYIQYLTLQDSIYSAMTQQVTNQQALGFEVGETKKQLIAQLYNRAESFSGMVELVIKKREELNILIGLKADNQALKDTLAVITEQLVVSRVSFSLTVELLHQLDFDASFYQQTLLKLGGQITTDLLDVSILSGMVNRFVMQISEYLIEHGGEWIFKILLLIAIYYVFRSLAKLATKVLTKSLNSSNINLSSLMKKMIISSASRLIMILGVFIALAQLGISLAPILAGLGVAGFIIGFALQDTLSNFASGMMILIYRPYDVGDLVEVGGGVFGKVESMNLVSTTILTIDNQTLVIPNSKIWGDVIKNVTSQKLRRVDLVFGIGYSDDIEKTEAVLTELVLAHPLVLKDPEPVIRLHVLNESSVDFVVRPWVKTEDYWDVYWDLTRQVKMRFDQDGITIPFPQRDVHFYPVAAPTE